MRLFDGRLQSMSMSKHGIEIILYTVKALSAKDASSINSLFIQSVFLYFYFYLYRQFKIHQ
jgi:hypothetical protein